MKNILFLQIYGGGGISGGTEVYLKNLLKELSKKNRENNYFIASFNKRSNIFIPFASIYDSFFTRFLESWHVVNLAYKFPLLGLFQYIWGIYWQYHISSRLIPEKKIHLIYSNGGNLTAIVAYLLYKKYKIPYILHFHGLFNFKEQLDKNGLFSLLFLKNKITKLSIQNASYIIGNSKEVVEDINSVSGIKKKAEIVHCFVDTDIFYPKSKITCRNKLGFRNDTFIFLSPNRLDKDKGIDFLLKSIPLIKDKNMMFIFVGDGYLKDQIIQLSKEDVRVKYFPQINNSLLPEYISAADIIWGAASVHYIGLSIIEALACGKPIMALNRPSPPDNNFNCLVNQKTIPSKIGYLVDNNPSSFAQFMTSKNNQKSIRAKISKICIDFYEKEYGLANFKKISKIIYNEVK